MRSRYQHTQTGTALLIALGVPILILLVVYALTKPSLPFAVFIPILLITASLFASLTIEIRDGLLCWRFGVGAIRKSVRLADIQAVEIVKNPWWYGFGIHLTPRGWLYNVSGLRGVEITLKNGKYFRLGTDDPENLAQAIKESLRV